jgi:virulence-associated protein VagC
MKKTVNKLESMTGEKYLYGDEKIILQDVDYTDEGIISVFTDKKAYTFTEQEAERFIKDCELIAGSQELAIIKPLAQQSSDLFASMKTVMEDTINKVKDNPEYVPQAKELNNSVKNMLEMSKQQIDLIKILKK